MHEVKLTMNVLGKDGPILPASHVKDRPDYDLYGLLYGPPLTIHEAPPTSGEMWRAFFRSLGRIFKWAFVLVGAYTFCVWLWRLL